MVKKIIAAVVVSDLGEILAHTAETTIERTEEGAAAFFGKELWVKMKNLGAHVSQCEIILLETPAIQRAQINEREVRCKICNGLMGPGMAIAETLVGLPDFIGSEEVCTVSPGGSGRMVECINARIAAIPFGRQPPRRKLLLSLASWAVRWSQKSSRRHQKCFHPDSCQLAPGSTQQKSFDNQKVRMQP